MNREERRKLHPEIDDCKAQIDHSVNVHPKQRGAWPLPKPSKHCPCQDGGKPCPVHDPVIAEGDWDA
jgi:hypothetical protein